MCLGLYAVASKCLAKQKAVLLSTTQHTIAESDSKSSAMTASFSSLVVVVVVYMWLW